MVNIFRPSTWLPTARREQKTEGDRSPAADSHETAFAEDKDQQPPQLTAPPVQQIPLRQRIEERAYQIWCEAGCPIGEDSRHWLQAEREILEEMNRGKQQP